MAHPWDLGPLRRAMAWGLLILQAYLDRQGSLLILGAWCRRPHLCFCKPHMFHLEEPSNLFDLPLSLVSGWQPSKTLAPCPERKAIKVISLWFHSLSRLFPKVSSLLGWQSKWSEKVRPREGKCRKNIKETDVLPQALSIFPSIQGHASYIACNLEECLLLLKLCHDLHMAAHPWGNTHWTSLLSPPFPSQEYPVQLHGKDLWSLDYWKCTNEEHYAIISTWEL